MPSQRPFFALGLRLAAALTLSTIYLLVKLAARSGVALPEILFWRQIVAAPAIAGWLLLRGELGRLRTRRPRSHAFRAATGMVGMALTFGAAILLPLAVATILGFTTPLFAVMLSALVLKEPVGRWRWLSVALGFVGVLVIAHPGSMVMSPLGAAVGIGAGLMLAVISIQLRDLGRSEEPTAIVFWYALFGALVMAPALPFVMHGHTAWQWAILAGIGVVGMVTQLLLTASLRFGSVASVVVMDYTALVWMTLYGWRFFGALPPATTWLGAPLIIAAGLVIAWREQRARVASAGAGLEAQ